MCWYVELADDTLRLGGGQFEVFADQQWQRVSRPAQEAAGRLVQIVEHCFLGWRVLSHPERVTKHAPAGATNVGVEFCVSSSFSSASVSAQVHALFVSNSVI